MPRTLQRGDKIFIALALEFFLRGFESRNARGYFFPLGGGVVAFGHAIPLILISRIGERDWGANWDTVLQDYGDE